MNSLFYKISVLIEQYYLELFALEILLIILAVPSIRILERMIIAVVVATVLCEVIKIFVKESRPATALNKKFYKRSFKLNLRSFPSTHSAVAMVFAGLLINSFIFIPIFIFGAIVAYSRVYIKDHYIHDVIAGGTIGFVIGYLVIALV